MPARLPWPRELSRVITTTDARVKAVLCSPLHREIVRAAVVVSALTLVVKCGAMAREIFIARAFGVSDGLDAYLAAFAPLALATALVASLNAAFIPAYVQTLDREGTAAAHELLRSVAWRGALALGVLTLVMVLAGRQLLTAFVPGFSSRKVALTYELFVIMTPVVVLTGACTLWTAVLNCTGRFAVGALAPLAVSLTIAVTLPAVTHHANAYALAWSTTGGYALQTAFLATALRRRGVPLLPSRRARSPETGHVMRQFGPMVAGALLLGTSPLVDQAMASLLPEGSISTLIYGSRIATQLTGLMALPIGTAILPAFSRLVMTKDWKRVRRTLSQYTMVVFAMSVPLTITLFVFSDAVVRLFYQRGAFSPNDSIQVAAVQRMFVLQVPFYTTSMLFVRLISALRRNQLLMWGNLISVGLNVTLNFVLMRHMGVAGIALATSIMYATAFCFLGVAVHTLLARWAAEPPAEAPGVRAA